MVKTYFFAETKSGQIVTFNSISFKQDGRIHIWNDPLRIQAFASRIGEYKNTHYVSNLLGPGGKPGMHSTFHSIHSKDDISFNEIRSIWTETLIEKSLEV